MATALELTGTLADAEDVVQDAFYRALQELDRFEEGRRFRPWFFTILRNLGRNRLAHRERRGEVSLTWSVQSDRADPSEEAQRRELEDRLLRAVEDLPERQRACFRLCALEGYEAREVAEMLGIAPPTVRTHLHRAREALRPALRPFIRGEHQEKNREP